ncbi:GNAT family N-acetyltransferase [Streptomyces sp. NPDC101776]|uniref:GNAT family N-acetyltransferase n=1 Tax=Streptomyces sp. NPDC101776 TaxID=3366146 RepID=UPI003816B83F
MARALSTPPVIASGILGGPPTRAPHHRGLLLRPWEEADVPAFLSACQDDEIRRWHTRRPVTEPQVRKWFDAYRQDWKHERGGHWAITRDSVEVLGPIALRGLDFDDGTAGAAYWVLPAARGAGVASHALLALTTWALDEIGFHRLELDHSNRNPASCRVATKSGYLTQPCNGIPGLLTRIKSGTPQPTHQHARRHHSRTARPGWIEPALLAGRLPRPVRPPPPHRDDSPIDFWTSATAHAHPADLTALADAASRRGVYREAVQLHKHATTTPPLPHQPPSPPAPQRPPPRPMDRRTPAPRRPVPRGRAAGGTVGGGGSGGQRPSRTACRRRVLRSIHQDR